VVSGQASPRQSETTDDERCDAHVQNEHDIRQKSSCRLVKRHVAYRSSFRSRVVAV
jgi:hypothetical protein